MADFRWRSTDGSFDIASNWANTTFRINPARVAPAANDNASFDTGGGTITGTGAVAGLSINGGNAVLWSIAGQLAAGLTLINGQTLITGAGTLDGGALTVGAGGLLSMAASGAMRASSLLLAAGSAVAVAGTGRAVIGSSTGTDGALTVSAGATLTAHGGLIQADVVAGGSLSNDGGLTIAGSVTGAGTLVANAGLTDVRGSLGVGTITFGAAPATLRVHDLLGTASVSGFRAGDAIDVTGATAFTLATTASGTTLTAGGGTLALGTAPTGTEFKVFGDGHGGLDLLLDAPPPANAIEVTDATTGTAAVATGEAYAGPVDYLQRQFIASGPDDMAMRANTPNTFLKGSTGRDALQAMAGSNVLDGGGGSNFLVGATGTDGGFDTFFIDGRGGVETWSTLVNFHQGDQATIWGFHAGLSTRPYTESAGAAGYTGLTIHSELNGPGTGILASVTFAGITQATADAHFSITTGPATPGAGSDYLLIQYNR